MDQPVCCGVNPFTPGNARAEVLNPPPMVHGAVGTLQQAQADFGFWRIECLANKTATRVLYTDQRRLLGSGEHVTAEDPGVTAYPAFRPARANSGSAHARSG